MTRSPNYLRAVVRKYGSAFETVKLEHWPLAPRQLNETQVRMTYASINPSDLITISGAYAPRTQLPLTPGFEGIGNVVASDLFPAAQRVLPIGSIGTW